MDEKKLKKLKTRANNQYRGITNAIQAIDRAVSRFYEQSSKYAKLLRKIEDELKNDK